LNDACAKTFLKICERPVNRVISARVEHIQIRGYLNLNTNLIQILWSFSMKKLIAALIASMFAVGAFAADAAPAAAPEASAMASKPAKKHKHHAKKAAHKAEAASAAASK
jgi:hypothetical protein